MIVILINKELKANPITDDGWLLLGSYLKSRLLNELKLVEDKELRSEMREDIQNRDYDVNDVIRSRRRDVFNRMLWMVFQGNAGITEQNVFDLIQDENWINDWRTIMEASGITYRKSESEEANPTE
jgi:hypothetical protein